MHSLFEELSRLMVAHRFRPNPRRSQNFLISPAAIESMVSAGKVTSKDTVLEIGCGTGFLTRALLERASVTGFEIDPALCEVLEKEIRNPRFTLHAKDFRDAPADLLFSKLVCAPPYHLSSELVHWLYGRDFASAVLLFQKEFVDKLTAEPGFAQYTATSVLTQYFYRVTPGDLVPASAFYPRPRGDSRIVVLSPQKQLGRASDDARFVRFVQELFRYKKKDFAKALAHAKPFLKKHVGWDQKRADAFLEEDDRAHEKVSLLGVEDFVFAFDALFA